MNNLIDITYVLHNLWRGIKRVIEKYNIYYLVLPVVYLVMLSLIVPSPMVEVNTIGYTKLDAYNEKIVTNIDRMDYILNKYNLSKQEFNILSAIVLSEAEDNSYEDAYAVINTIYNRTHSKNWVRSVASKFGSSKGNNLYYQAISPRQFTVYASGSYKKHLNDTDSVGYQAIIDFLYTENIMHNYLSFRSHSIKIKNSESYSTKGNNYFNEIKEENRI